MSLFCIEVASPADAAELLAIYAPYVTDTSITFEYDVPSVEEFRARIEETLTRYPYLIARMNGRIVGYAYAHAFKARAAYDWAVETSIYVAQDCHSQGIGKALYGKLEELLAQQGVQNLNACITYPNPGSEAFHQRLGYCTVAHFSRCGYKLGQWHDMIWMEKHLGNHSNPPPAFIPFSSLHL